MKINICDVCYNESGSKDIVKSKFRISYKNRLKGIRIALDVCPKHQNYFKEVKTFDEAYARYNKLLFGKEA